MADPKLDEVGVWTEIKLRILRDYAAAYTTILGQQSAIRHYAYIDGCAGAGSHISKASGAEIDGSPAIALSQEFSHYHFVDLDGTRTERLRQLASGRSNVSVYEGDCNEVLLKQVFPKCRYGDYRRALCLLDPYGLNPNWDVVRTAGEMRSIEVFLNFMIMDANMNVLWADPERVPEAQILRMNTFWGDDSWRQAAYKKEAGLFGDIEEKASNSEVVTAYRQRLKDVAGFEYVPEPIPMRNSQGAVVYYLFFASHNQTGDKIARAVFKKYRNAGV
jgi:three-Cys-motif partner protein